MTSQTMTRSESPRNMIVLYPHLRKLRAVRRTQCCLDDVVEGQIVRRRTSGLEIWSGVARDYFGGLAAFERPPTVLAACLFRLDAAPQQPGMCRVAATHRAAREIGE